MGRSTRAVSALVAVFSVQQTVALDMVAAELGCRPRELQAPLKTLARDHRAVVARVDGVDQVRLLPGKGRRRLRIDSTADFARIADPKAVDPADAADALEALRVALADQGAAHRRRHAGCRAAARASDRPPVAVVLGAEPWPPRELQGRPDVCPVCRDRLPVGWACGWCDR